MPYGLAIWQGHVAQTYGSTTWHRHMAEQSHMAKPYGKAICLQARLSPQPRPFFVRLRRETCSKKIGPETLNVVMFSLIFPKKITKNVLKDLNDK